MNCKFINLPNLRHLVNKHKPHLKKCKENYLKFYHQSKLKLKIKFYSCKIKEKGKLKSIVRKQELERNQFLQRLNVLHTVGKDEKNTLKKLKWYFQLQKKVSTRQVAGFEVSVPAPIFVFCVIRERQKKLLELLSVLLGIFFMIQLFSCVLQSTLGIFIQFP